MTAAIRPFEAADWSSLWPILQTTNSGGDTFAFSPDSSESDMYQAWIALPVATFVSCGGDGTVLGSYFIKQNQPGLGAHVCNAGYVVAAQARGQGIAAAMCEHSQQEARARGFRAMQFNLVVATNTRAVRLWQRMGFAIVGTLPAAYCHRSLGYVDALVMFKSLRADSQAYELQ